MELTTKFDIGDVVTAIGAEPVKVAVPCAVCGGTGRAAVVNYDKTICCPACEGSGSSGAGLMYRFRVVTRSAVGKLGVDVDSNGVRNEKYMLESTGINVGNVYDVENLFRTDEEALAACAEREAEYNEKYIRDGRRV